MRVTFAALLLMLSACNRDSPDALPEGRAAVPVSVARVERASVSPTQPVAGTVRPFERAAVAARVMGTVAAANFTIGQKVSAGDVLLTIEAGELNARLEQARAALDLAARDATREAGLLDKGASTGETVRTAEDRLRIARAAFDEATTLVSYSRITAPFAGHVTRKLVYTGDFVNVATPLFEVEARERMRAEIEVPDALPALPIGAGVRVVTGGTSVVGHISEAASAVHPATRTRSVIVELPSGSPFHSGEFVRVLWPTEPADRLLIPAAAVQPFGQVERVFVVADHRVTLRIVRTGLREGERVQILAGLEVGEMVVVASPVALRDGHPVQLQP